MQRETAAQIPRMPGGRNEMKDSHQPPVGYLENKYRSLVDANSERLTGVRGALASAAGGKKLGSLMVTSSSPGEEAQTFAKMEKINKSLSIRIVPTSNVISVRVSWSDPHAAQQILETLMRAYLVERRTVFEPKQVREFFNTQLENYTHQLERKKGEILDLVKQRRTPDPAAALENNLALKRSISEQLNDLEGSRDRNRVEMRSQNRNFEFDRANNTNARERYTKCELSHPTRTHADEPENKSQNFRSLSRNSENRFGRDHPQK